MNIVISDPMRQMIIEHAEGKIKIARLERRVNWYIACMKRRLTTIDVLERARVKKNAEISELVETLKLADSVIVELMSNANCMLDTLWNLKKDKIVLILRKYTETE